LKSDQDTKKLLSWVRNFSGCAVETQAETICVSGEF